MSTSISARPLPATATPANEVRLSWGQIRLWTLDQIDGRNASYNDAYPWRLTGSLDRPALAAALADVLKRHATLRTVIEMTNGRPRGRLLPPPHPDDFLKFEDLSGLEAPSRDQALRALLDSQVGRPFNLAAERPSRALLVRLGPHAHVLCMTFHHSAADSNSDPIFYGDLSIAYDARRAGRSPAWPGGPVSYAERTGLIEEDLDESGRLAAQLRFWRERLAGAPDLLPLPTDHPRLADRSRALGVVRFSIDPDLVERLRVVGHRHQATLFRVCLTAFAAAMGRLAGVDDLIIGIPVSGRGQPETERLVGFLVNTLPLRLNLAGQPDAATLISRTSETVVAALGQQDAPFERLVEAMGAPRTRTHTPMVQVMFNWINRGEIGPALAGTTMERIPMPTPRVKLDLEARMRRAADGTVTGVFEYDASLFDPATVLRWKTAYVKMLEAVASEAGPLAAASLLAPDDLKTVLRDFNATQRPPSPHDLAGLFAVQAAAAPSEIALQFGDRRLTYAQLNDAADSLAGRLQARGIGPEHRVGVAMERSEEMVISLLAILKAGGAWLPLDPNTPESRLRGLIDDGAVTLLLTDQRTAPRVAGIAPPLVVDAPLKDRDSTPLRRIQPHQNSLAYVIHTSGSTGRPKGVAVTLGALTNLLADMRRRLSIAPDDRILGLTALSFDIAALEIFLPLISGARLVLADGAAARDPALAVALVRETGVTLIQSTPSRWRALLAEGLSGVRALVGGEPFPVDLSSPLATSADRAFNLYGPTETTIWSTAYALRHAPGHLAPVPIGTPIDNTQLYLLDDFLAPVPWGAPGELYIAGTGLARGYWRDAALSAQRFVASPFGPPGARMYRTGDLARWRADGVLEFLGRTDRQLKLRGFRVEPAEIETALLTIPGVGNAVVAPHDSDGDVRLVAYLSAAAGEALPTEGSLRLALARTLPNHLIPAAFVPLESLPMTSGGKIDQAALPTPGFGPSVAGVGPTSAAEQTLLRLFKQITGARRIGVHDSFFDVGGNSLQGVRLMFEIEREFGNRPRLEMLFNAPTVSALARRLADVDSDPVAISVVRLESAKRKTPLFMIHWIERDLVRRLGAERPVYGLSYGLGQQGGQATPAMPRSVAALADHYVDQLRLVRPSGPYVLLGHSAGGVVAYEMARKLRDAGEAVAFLGLVDTYAPAALEGRRRLSMIEVFGRVMRTSPTLLYRYALNGLRKKAGAYRPTRKHGAAEDLERQRRGLIAFIGDYHPQPFDGTVNLFKSGTPDSPVRSEPPPPPELHWRPLAVGGLHVHVLTGGHLDLVKDPHAERTAAAINAAIDAIDASGCE